VCVYVCLTRREKERKEREKKESLRVCAHDSDKECVYARERERQRERKREKERRERVCVHVCMSKYGTLRTARIEDFSREPPSTTRE